jgi:hypothetical protein
MNEGTRSGKSTIRLLGISAERPTNGLYLLPFLHIKMSSVRWLVARSDRKSVGYSRVPASSVVNTTVLGTLYKSGTCSTGVPQARALFNRLHFSVLD